MEAKKRFVSSLHSNAFLVASKYRSSGVVLGPWTLEEELVLLRRHKYVKIKRAKRSIAIV